MGRPIVSVVITVYNGEKYIFDALTSVQNQTYTDWEIIVVDDHCTDNTASEVERFIKIEPTRVKWLPNRYEKGIPGGINTGIDVSKGKYIAIMHADDICEPTRLQDQVTYCSLHPDIAVISGDIKYFGDGQEVITYPVSDSQIKAMLLFENPIAHPAVMFNTDVITKEDLRYNIEARYIEDLELWVRLALKNYKFGSVGKVVLNYRKHIEQKSAVDSFTIKAKDMSMIFSKIFQSMEVDFTQYEMDLFLKMFFELDIETKNDLVLLTNLLRRLKDANKVSGLFDNSEFSKQMSYTFFKTCYLATRKYKMFCLDLFMRNFTFNGKISVLKYLKFVILSFRNLLFK
jgi:glycosyltransferase involved in cell wall biosynthesis